MTVPSERSCAVVDAREFLEKLLIDDEIPERIRKDADRLLRHYPSAGNIEFASFVEEEAATRLNLPQVFGRY